MNYKHWLRMIGRAVSFGCLGTWWIIFITALLFSNNRAVRVTIRANVLHEFWFEFGLLSVGMVGWLYDYYVRKSLEDAKKDRETIAEDKETPSE